MRAAARVALLASCMAVASALKGEPDDVPNALRRLKEIGGFYPQGIIDVGAHKGDWTRMALTVFPDSQYLLLEGDADLEPELKETGKPYEIGIVGSHDGTVVWHQHKQHKTGNSLYLENSNAFRGDPSGVEKLTKKMRTLETIIDGRGENVTYQLLKCDVQGAELDVIRGAQRLADSIEVVVLEVSLVSYNEGAPGISKVVSTMFLHGFDIIDVAEVHYWASSLEILGQMDLVFAQRGSPLFAAYGRAMGLVAR